MKNLAAVFIVAVAYSLMGCSPKHPIKVISLEMRSQDEFALDGKAIKSSELRNALHALINPDQKICVEVSVAKSISYEEQRVLTDEIRSAGISCVGITGADG